MPLPPLEFLPLHSHRPLPPWCKVLAVWQEGQSNWNAMVSFLPPLPRAPPSCTRQSSVSPRHISPGPDASRILESNTGPTWLINCLVLFTVRDVACAMSNAWTDPASLNTQTDAESLNVPSDPRSLGS